MYIVLRILYLVVHISTYFQPAGQLITYFVPRSTVFFIFGAWKYNVLHILYLFVHCSTVYCSTYSVPDCTVHSSTSFLPGCTMFYMYFIPGWSLFYKFCTSCAKFYIFCIWSYVHCSPCILYLVIHGVLFAKVLAVLGQHLRKHNMSLVSNKKKFKAF